ncbi:MAG: TetR/AcrR family transcriptional regulator [Lysobacteraceae bacterium]|nr:MAG: TetR/AcrR family transcriptional regulator [Xanthomonadaceae bacterium]
MTGLPATNKGVATRSAILERACEMASMIGLEGLSIGSLAAAVGMSKSGVFVHFGSREELQLAVIDLTAQRFVEHILSPALAAKRGLPRLHALVRAWFAWIRNHRGSCLLLSAIVEYDDRPGALHDRIVSYQLRWRDELMRAITLAIECGDLPPEADKHQLAFEVNAIALGVQHDAAVSGIDEAIDRGERMLERMLPRRAVTQSAIRGT